MAQQKKIGVAWGITSSGFTYTGSATVLAVTPTGQSLRKTGQKVKIKGKDGETQGLVYFDKEKVLQLRVFPSGATIAAAAAANVLPSVGDKFVITDASDADVAGNYVVDECSKDKGNEKYAEFEVTLSQQAVDCSDDTAAA